MVIVTLASSCHPGSKGKISSLAREAKRWRSSVMALAKSSSRVLALDEATVLDGIDLRDHPLGEVHEVHIGRAVFVLVEAEDVDVVDVVRGDGVLDLIVLEVLKRSL